jgi:hypothetical protein
MWMLIYYYCYFSDQQAKVPLSCQQVPITKHGTRATGTIISASPEGVLYVIDDLEIRQFGSGNVELLRFKFDSAQRIASNESGSLTFVATESAVYLITGAQVMEILSVRAGKITNLQSFGTGVLVVLDSGYYGLKQLFSGKWEAKYYAGTIKLSEVATFVGSHGGFWYFWNPSAKQMKYFPIANAMPPPLSSIRLRPTMPATSLQVTTGALYYAVHEGIWKLEDGTAGLIPCSGLDGLHTLVLCAGTLYGYHDNTIFQLVLDDPSKLPETSFDLRDAIGVATDAMIIPGDRSTSVHRSLIKQRCLGLLPLLDKGEFFPISTVVIKHFIDFLYGSDVTPIPPTNLTLCELTELGARFSFFFNQK